MSRQSHAPSLSLTTSHRAVKSRFQPNTRYKCDTGTRTWNDRNYEPIVGPDRLRFHLDKIQWRLCSLLLATASVHCSWRLVAVRASSCTFAPILGTRNTEQFCVWSCDPLSKFNLLQMFSYFRVVQIPVPKLSTEILWTLSTKIATLLGQTEHATCVLYQGAEDNGCKNRLQRVAWLPRISFLQRRAHERRNPWQKVFFRFPVLFNFPVLKI